MVRGWRTPGTSQKPGGSKQSASSCLVGKKQVTYRSKHRNWHRPQAHSCPLRNMTQPQGGRGAPRILMDPNLPSPHWPTRTVLILQFRGLELGEQWGPERCADNQEGTDCSDIWTPVRCDLEVRAPPCRGGLGPVGPTHPEPQVRECEPRAHSKRC